MSVSLELPPASSAVADPRAFAIERISQAAALVAVSAGAPTEWRLCQVLTAIELFEQGWFSLAIDQARRAQLPLAAIPEGERSMTCPQPFGAVLHEVRKLKAAAPPVRPGNAFFALAA